MGTYKPTEPKRELGLTNQLNANELGHHIVNPMNLLVRYIYHKQSNSATAPYLNWTLSAMGAHPVVIKHTEMDNDG